MINIDLAPFSLQNVCADDSNGKKTASTSFTPYSVSKHCDVFLWAELRWKQKDYPDCFTNASYEVF